MGTETEQFFSPSPHPLKAHSRVLLRLGLTCLVLTAAYYFAVQFQETYDAYHSSGILLNEQLAREICPQPTPLIPSAARDLWEEIERDIGAEEFKVKAIEWLGGAINVATETFDDMGPIGEDSRWENRALFHKYLEKTFPLVHSILNLEKVNTYGLVYTWHGSDPSLKPILLMAHYDVVPVNPETVSEWEHPPYSGFYDGTNIWGRGSLDDKSALIGTISAIEILLSKGFKPTRTVLVQFGFDEEGGGSRGAGKIAEHLLEIYGEDSFSFVIDEGGGFSQSYGTAFATPGVAEKGSTNVNIEVSTPGGHSSVPPDHTSIGILSALLVHMENTPFESHIDRTTPTYGLFLCLAAHARNLSEDLRGKILDSVKSDEALRQVEKILFENKLYKSLIGTTQAIDIVHGGIKSNALPEQAMAIVNHRIAVTSSVSQTHAHDATLFLPLAEHFNLTYDAFGQTLGPSSTCPSAGTLRLTSGGGLNPAPVTPIMWGQAAPYEFLSGTIKGVYRAHRSLTEGAENVLNKQLDIIVAPGMPTGNTDTKYYWKLTPHIFRYNHHNQGSDKNALSGAHTVNEHVTAESLLETINFFVTLILNADESRVI
ncbi:carboxypeptidase S [Dendrothele bispora CBS 962.96]|uniref:Carboxypeptidase S n=1 Tax=Dendrothele bispora (strain CBS 962.96) TaxID=1314807 RepID=A0A4S8LP64_DENBC|nr:carboxypeptidase S [Dendrothele bispora CBS 962.96]